jgi:hypothetical protein
VAYFVNFVNPEVIFSNKSHKFKATALLITWLKRIGNVQGKVATLHQMAGIYAQ